MCAIYANIWTYVHCVRLIYVLYMLIYVLYILIYVLYMLIYVIYMLIYVLYMLIYEHICTIYVLYMIIYGHTCTLYMLIYGHIYTFYVLYSNLILIIKYAFITAIDMCNIKNLQITGKDTQQSTVKLYTRLL